MCERFLLRHGHRFHLTPERVARGRAFFERAGKWALLGGYFVPGVRHLVAYGSGMSDYGYPSFAVWAYSGAALWCGTFLTVGYLLGEGWHRYAHQLHGASLVLGSLILVAVGVGWLVWRRRRAESNV
jgi:membrane protein DedA with SNARE-associated domain